MARTQIFMASTLYGAATLAAALDADCFRPAHRRILLVSNNASVPETTPPLDRMPGFAALRDRFDRVLSWNEAISPFHPGGWTPRPDDVPLWERHLRLLWQLGDDEIELAVESIQVEPALAVVQLFPAAPIDVYADGLMSYGPTRNKLELLVTSRIRRLLHLDLVPGLTPLLLSEYGVRPEIVPTGAFTAVLAEVAAATPRDGEPVSADGPALLLGQYLSALEILTPEEEERLHVRMLRGVAARGHRNAVFKPHPMAPAHWPHLLEKEAAELGVEFTVCDTPGLAEVLFQRLRPALVVGCFSTALVTASEFFDLPVASTGTGLLLERLSPYQNSNRVPVTIADAVLPPLDERDRASRGGSAEPLSVAELTALLRAVGYCMQSKAYPRLRDDAIGYLAKNLNAGTRRYFKRRRLTSLALPGGVPSQLAFLPKNRTVRRVVRRARVLTSRVSDRQAGAR
ncbi:polysialyltransferase family glycosyltransferase [Streptantibioticus ferralitis]|uniref:Polysialyltransferase family glycosyltransferase n=1 Tax=Streptantibioticus ferralitis TaxID=236510 RepID=A0ABT5Z1Z9_9ACTN|nr:polysialyltransferase family glycosyltransferase [Streptantibioticus ferralitis]MDF2257871.1 polysialyltransferase family glycosyltransferase [Streptantibioticus ferralitis]